MRRGRGVGLALLAALVMTGCGSKDSASSTGPVEIQFYNWSSYIDPRVLDQFRQETGIRVRVATYPSAEALDTVLLTGQSQYDVVVASTNSLEVLAASGALSPLQRGLLKNWDNLETALLEKLAGLDAGNWLAVPYLWGVTGLAINATALKAAAPGVPTDSWGLLYDAALVAKVAKCRISVLDSPDDVIDTMLLYLGKNPNSTSPDDLEVAARRLHAIRGSIAKIASDDQISDLASGETCAQLTWTSNAVQAKRRAQELAIQADLRFVIPREGAMIFMDTLVIPKGTKHSAEAHAFIDFLLRADVAAKNANFVGGASPNHAALALINPELRNDPAIYPSAAVIAKLTQFRKRPPDATRITNRDWTRFRTGS